MGGMRRKSFQPSQRPNVSTPKGILAWCEELDRWLACVVVGEAENDNDAKELVAERLMRSHDPLDLMAVDLPGNEQVVIVDAAKRNERWDWDDYVLSIGFRERSDAAQELETDRYLAE